MAKLASIAFIMLGASNILCSAQNHENSVDSILQTASLTMSAMNNDISLSLSSAPVKEVLQALAVSSNLNLGFDPSITGMVTLNIDTAKVKDILQHLCSTQNLEPRLSQNILYIQKAIPSQRPERNPMIVEWDTNTSTLLINISSVKLEHLLKELSIETGHTIVNTEALNGRLVSGYVKGMSLENSLAILSKSWGLHCRKMTNNGFIFEEPFTTSGSLSSPNKAMEGMECKLAGNNTLCLRGKDVEIFGAMVLAAQLLKRNIIVPVKHSPRANFHFEEIGFDDLLSYLLTDSHFEWTMKGDVIIVSETGTMLRQHIFQHRSLSGVIDCIPKSMMDNLEVVPVPELNILLYRGPVEFLIEMDSLLLILDDTIPLILIELTIIDQHKSYKVSTGISASVQQEETVNSVQIFPYPDISFNTGKLNSILSALNDFGWYNLGYLTPEIQFEIQALEEQGILNIRSTPKLATLSGHPASMSIGTTEYYIEERNDVIGTQNPQNIQTRQFKSVNADFFLSIQPFVSGDGRVTMMVEVEQSDFTERISPDAPPGKVTRKFTSTIQVQNGQTVVLGGLEEKSSKDSSSGIPLLSRIPVLKWLTSSRSKERDKSKLIIFIQPMLVS